MQYQYGASYAVDVAVKILVLGDSGVGKSSLVHMLCHNEPLGSSMPTVGCNIDVRLHTCTLPTASATSSARSGIPSLLARNTSAADSSAGGETFIEFYDISGSPAVRHPKSRNMFYSGVTYQGVILVHDLCNRRSYENLWKWMGDYMEVSQSAAGLGAGTGGYSGGQYGELHIPLLVVGTKIDMAAASGISSGIGAGMRSGISHGQDLVEKYGGEAISVCSISPAEFMPNSSTSIAFNMFFGRVIDPSSSRSRTSSSRGSAAVYPSGAPPVFSRPPPTPTPTLGQQERPHYQERALSNESTSGSSAIPIMDFATFTGGSVTNSYSTEHDDYRVPTRSGSPSGGPGEVPGRSVTPTGMSIGSSTKSALRAQYERNRSVLSQYSNVSVPVYTSNSSSTSHMPSGTR